MLHNAVATGNFNGLTDEQKDLVQQCIDFREKLMRENGMSYFGSEVQLQVFKGDELLTEGWADDVLIRTEGQYTAVGHVIVIDYKFGWSPVTPAVDNIQAGAYCAGAMLKFGTMSAEAHIFQPRLHRSSSYVYTDQKAMVDNIDAIIYQAKSDRMLLEPGEAACRYCRARLSCPAFRIMFQNMSAASGKYDLTNPKVLESLYEASKEIKSFLKEIEDAVRLMIDATGRCGKYGYKVSEGRREVLSLAELYSRVSDFISQEKFLELCSITLGKLETQVADRIVQAAAERGEKVSKAEAKRTFYDLTKDLISRGNPTKTIAVVEE